MKYLIACLGYIDFMTRTLKLFGNNIQITNVSLEGQVFTGKHVFVELEFSWENS